VGAAILICDVIEVANHHERTPPLGFLEKKRLFRVCLEITTELTKVVVAQDLPFENNNRDPGFPGLCV